jgi:hypothetical protein
VKNGNDDSARVGSRMQSALSALDNVGGLPHDETVLAWSDGPSLAATVRARRIAIVYVTPGFGDDLDAIRGALDGVDVLSVTGVADYVPRGIVLGFDLVSGRPKLLLNITQARKQNVAFKAEVIRMMRVFE